MIKNQILPETAIYYKHQEEKKQKEKFSFNSKVTHRKNNRKTTKSRKLEKIIFVKSLIPLKMGCKEIKTFR